MINYVTCSTALIQLRKRYLKPTAIILKIRWRILQRICFEIRKNNSNLYVSKICGPFQARSQDLEKGGGGGFFERVRKVQTTSTRIFIALESVSHGLSEN